MHLNTYALLHQNMCIQKQKILYCFCVTCVYTIMSFLKPEWIINALVLAKVISLNPLSIV